MCPFILVVGVAGVANANVFEADLDCPLRFVDQQMIRVSIKEAFLHDSALISPYPYTVCEVYFPKDPVCELWF